MLCTTLTCHPPSPSTVYALLWPLITRAHAGFSIGSLPPSAHRMDFTHLMSSYSLFCFLFIVQCVPFCLIYQALFKPCSRGRIINFLFNFCRCHCCCIWAVDERLINFPQTSVRWRSVLKTGKQSSGRLKTKGQTCHFRCQLELARAFFFFPWHTASYGIFFVQSASPSDSKCCSHCSFRWHFCHVNSFHSPSGEADAPRGLEQLAKCSPSRTCLSEVP